MSSGRTTITPAIEEQMIAAIRRKQEDHITLPPDAYRPDGSVLVTRDGLSGVRAQRHLYRRLIGPLGLHQYLRPDCIQKGCLNPYHYRVTERSRDGLTHCRNGHEYTSENTLPDGAWRCRACRDADRKRRAERYREEHKNALRSPAEVNATKTHCDHGHEFTDENIYWRTTRTGRRQRQCRTCTIGRARDRAQRLREEKLESTTTLRKAS